MKPGERSGARRRARELALSALYMLDMREKTLHKSEIGEVLQDFFKEQLAIAKVKAYASKIVHGALDNRAEVDGAIEGASENWKLARIARIDKSILRLSTYELLFEPTVPPEVAIDEAIDLAKKYGGEESSSFVNGILDKIKKSLDKKSGGKKKKVEEEQCSSTS